MEEELTLMRKLFEGQVGTFGDDGTIRRDTFVVQEEESLENKPVSPPVKDNGGVKVQFNTEQGEYNEVMIDRNEKTRELQELEGGLQTKEFDTPEKIPGKVDSTRRVWAGSKVRKIEIERQD